MTVMTINLLYRKKSSQPSLSSLFEKNGYILHKANNIPGFYTDIDTGKKGPRVMILAELDALAVPNHLLL